LAVVNAVKSYRRVQSGECIVYLKDCCLHKKDSSQSS